MNTHKDNNPNTQGAISVNVFPEKKKKKQPKPNPKPKNRKKIQGGMVAYEGRIPDRIRELARGDFAQCCGVPVGQRDEFLAALLMPREFDGARVPDPFVREPTSTYQAKVTVNIVGAQGTVVGATSDQGRFCFVLNPCISDTPTFATANAGWLYALKDGVNNTGVWTNNFAASSATSFDTYTGDVNQATWVNSVNTGIMNKVRPVSASVLASYNGQILNGGGNIAAGLFPASTWELMLTNGTAGISPAKWENLAQYKGMYDGPLSKGAYAYWLPDSETDYLFRTCKSALDDSTFTHDYPVLVVAGQISSPSGGFSGSTQLRIDAYVNFEYTTVSRIVGAKHGSKDQSQMIRAMTKLANQPSSMENITHVDIIKGIIAGAAGFFLGGPVGAVAGAAAALTGSSIFNNYTSKK